MSRSLPTNNNNNLVSYLSYGVRLSPIGTAATVLSLVPVLDDR
jgi:hypothetical protein